MDKIDQSKLFKQDWRTLWWYIDKLFFFYGLHPRHFYRLGWRIKYSGPPRTVILRKRLDISETFINSSPTLDPLINVKTMTYEKLASEKELYSAFVSEWGSETWVELARTEGSRGFVLVVEGYKRRYL